MFTQTNLVLSTKIQTFEIMLASIQGIGFSAN